MEEKFLEFEWDSEKARRNLRKHSISFGEGMMVLMTYLRSPIMTMHTQGMNKDS